MDGDTTHSFSLLHLSTRGSACARPRRGTKYFGKLEVH